MLTTTRRQRLADAALATLATLGSRGLTHRAVDTAADLPEGTTSYYFRTRDDLLAAAAERLAQDDADRLTDLPTESLPGLIEALAATISSSGTNRMLHLARLELTLEGTRRPHLRRTLSDSGQAVHDALTRQLESCGLAAASDAATALLVVVDGILLDALAGPDARVLSQEHARTLLWGALPGR